MDLIFFIQAGAGAVKISETFGSQAGGFSGGQSKDLPVSIEETRRDNFDYDYRMGIGGCRVDLQLRHGLAQMAGVEGRGAEGKTETAKI
jgi:hypothetical protein